MEDRNSEMDDVVLIEDQNTVRGCFGSMAESKKYIRHKQAFDAKRRGRSDHLKYGNYGKIRQNTANTVKCKKIRQKLSEKQ